MDLTLSTLLALLRLTLQSPREGAQAVMRLSLPGNARWLALLLLAVLSALATQVLSLTLTPVGSEGLPALSLGPFFWVAFSVGTMVLTAALVHWIGKWRGGTGRFDDALILVVWLQFIQLVIGIVQALLLLALPFASDFIYLATLALFLWLLTNFVAELHGFRSLGLVFLGVILTQCALALVFGLLLLLPFMNLGA